MVFMLMNTTKSTSGRQGRKGDRPSEGSRSTNVRADEQKPYTRLSPWASWHNTTKPEGSWGRVNAAVVHGKFTFLSGEICHSLGTCLLTFLVFFNASCTFSTSPSNLFPSFKYLVMTAGSLLKYSAISRPLYPRLSNDKRPLQILFSVSSPWLKSIRLLTLSQFASLLMGDPKSCSS